MHTYCTYIPVHTHISDANELNTHAIHDIQLHIVTHPLQMLLVQSGRPPQCLYHQIRTLAWHSAPQARDVPASAQMTEIREQNTMVGNDSAKLLLKLKPWRAPTEHLRRPRVAESQTAGV